ncbi:CHRAC1 family protein [Megaselia abdita]
MPSLIADFQIPPSRIRTIMKSTEDAANISQEAIFLVAKATEMFINDLTEKSFDKGKKGNTLKYEDLAEYVNDENNLEFLLQIIPKKMSVKEYLEMATKDERESDESTSESEDDK